jgi:1-acyl-sn-glycerol-3-phosphate acyltransferase
MAGKPTILMSNHQSLYDIPLVFVALPGSIRMLTKKELFRVPIWGRALAAGEFVSIDRRNHKQALRDLADARRKMEDGIVLWVAPEGTRTRDGYLGPFKKGAFMLALETGARIIPIGIRGATDALLPDSFHARLGCTAEVRLGAPIDAATYSVDSRADLMREVETRICELAAIEPRPGKERLTEPVQHLYGSRART